MSSSSNPKTQLLDMPEEVFETGLFPCLGVNDVLRFRATCKTAKTLSEDYLRRHPRSQSKVRIIFHPEGERVYLRSADEWALNAFLSEDASSSIRIPTGLFEFQSRFYQSFNIFGHSRLPDFLEKYGNQIKYLTVPSLQIPMGYEEWEFYKKVPKLKGLTVQMLKIVPELIPEPENVTFPEIFKQLEILEIPRTATPNSGLLWKWKLVEQCTKLKTISWHLQLPGEFEKMRELLEHGKLKKLQCCYIDFVSGFGEYQIAEVAVPWIPGLCELVKKYQLKLLNANSKYLSKFAITQMEQIAPHISSIKWAPLSEPYEFLTVGVFENVEKIRIASFAIDELPRMSNKTGRAITRASGAQCERLRRSLSPAIFPNLKKFEFDIDMYRGRNDTNLVLALMWGWLPNLEEVIFKNSGGLSNVAFLGVKQDRPFLLLTKLRALKINFPGSRLNDVAFSEVFLRMSVREFRLVTHESLPLKSITSAGIRSLLTGPFRNSVELFPFHGWSLPYLNKREFQQLAQEFPCNKF